MFPAGHITRLCLRCEHESLILQRMSWRRFIAVMTAVLFLLSTAGHGFVLAGMAYGMSMEMAAGAADMASHDDPMDCGEHADCTAKKVQMACFAHCASVTGILSEPAGLSIIGAARELTAAVARPLPSLHGPPDPHPPKSIVLI